MDDISERYFQILRQVSLATSGQQVEEYLAAAYELGRSLVDRMAPPDEMASMHHQAIVRLSQAFPALILAELADRLTLPLLEMSMAYGIAFREHSERQDQVRTRLRQEQSSRLEAIGTLAAGIAHDFNNILGSIAGFAEMAGDDLPDGSEGKNCVRQILTACFRARDLIARILIFARSNSDHLVPVEVVSLVREALVLLSVPFREKTQVCFQSSLDRAEIIADPGHIQQIVMNLCLNAADAMEGPAKILVNIDQATLDGGRMGVCLTVADNGSGMKPEVLERVFDPFFTTKEPGKGSGLGLSVVYGIVSQLGGVVEVQSRSAGERRGTEFKVFLPMRDACGET